MDEFDPNMIQTASAAISSVTLGIARAFTPDAAARTTEPTGSQRQTEMHSAVARIAEMPTEIHDPSVPLSPMEAVRSRGLKWLISMVRQNLRAQWQLRRCTSLGKWVRVRGNVKVHNEGTIVVRDRVRFRSESAISELVAWKGGRLEIGEGTTLNYGTSISAASEVIVGRNCLIGTYVNIMDSNFHNMSDHSWNMDSEPVVIEDDVWLGNRCMITKGVTVGRGSVVAACSLVTKNVPPHTLVVGVPARVVQHL